jgi:hypothetical protein
MAASRIVDLVERIKLRLHGCSGSDWTEDGKMHVVWDGMGCRVVLLVKLYIGTSGKPERNELRRWGCSSALLV